MNSRKNPSVVVSLASASLTLLLMGSGCASIFSRSSAEGESSSENQSRNSEKNSDKNSDRYSANEERDEASRDPKLKDEKIQSLETTVLSLNSRIQELEGKLQAAQNRPTLPDPLRQDSDAASRKRPAGTAVTASVASNDPESGFVNDGNVRAFQQGKLLFDQEKYPEAILALSAFLEREPSHPLSGSAQYLIGESYFLQGDPSVAAQEYQKVLKRYPRSPRVSYALVRLALCYEKTGNSAEANRYRLQAENLFSQSPALALLSKKGAANSLPSQSSAISVPPIATAPEDEGSPIGDAIEKPIPPQVIVPTVEVPHVETPVVEAPRVDTGESRAPRANVGTSVAFPASDLDAPPGMGGGG